MYDFHSLTVYRRFRYAPLALSLAGEQMPQHITADHFRRLAETCGGDPDVVVGVVAETVDRLRASWKDVIAVETQRRFPDLAEHFEQRLVTLPLTLG